MPEVVEYQPSTATLDTVKEFIHAYKRTKDPAYFEDILGLTDNLLVSIVFRVKRSYRYLKAVSAMELYQTAIIGLYEAVDKIYLMNDPAGIIPARINSYIISNVKKSYSYLEKAHESMRYADGQEREPAWDSPKMCKEPDGTHMILDDLSTLVKCHVITRWDRKLLIDRYIKGMSNNEMAKNREVGYRRMSERIKVVLKKVAVYFK